MGNDSSINGLPQMADSKGNRNQVIVFTTSLTIQSIGKATYCIYNLAGVVLEKGTYAGSVQVGNKLKEGMYILILVEGTKQQTTRILKAK